jgi:single-stranded-DNA-specific exonuclease
LVYFVTALTLTGSKAFSSSLDNLHDPYLMEDMEKANASRKQSESRKYSCFAIMMLMHCCFTRFFLFKTYYLMLLPIFRIGMKVTAFHLKELTLQMTMVFAYYRFRLWYKSIDHVAPKQKYWFYNLCPQTREFLQAVAILDPKRDDCTYPYDELCGCGIGFKLIQALGPKPNHRRFDSVFRFRLPLPLISFPWLEKIEY